MKKEISILVAIICSLVVFISGSNIIFAADNSQLLSNDLILIENGFPKENIGALSEEHKRELVKYLNDNPNNVDIQTSVLEIDNLMEIESFMGFSDEELIGMGANSYDIASAREELYKISKQTEEQIAKEKNISLTEAKYLKRAIVKGKNKDGKDVYKENNSINASGSISASKLTYSQAYANHSTATAPSYWVVLTYTWNSPYTLTIFTDEVVAAWGGNLNTKNVSGYASYYNENGSNWGSYNQQKLMTTSETANAGIEFKFAQSVSLPSATSNRIKTKTGSIGFELYQTKKQGYDTKLLSQYCHRVISIGNASIGISAKGATVSISIGGAWDSSPQKSSIISY